MKRKAEGKSDQAWHDALARDTAELERLLRNAVVAVEDLARSPVTNFMAPETTDQLWSVYGRLWAHLERLQRKPDRRVENQETV